MKNILEACIDSLDQAKYFIDKNIDRFETCSKLNLGGLTPEMDLFKYIRDNSNAKQVIMLRTNDNFTVNNDEIETIKKQIQSFKKEGANSFIFGFIKNNEIDLEFTKILIKELHDTEYCFHMAIDELGNYEKNIPLLIELGFSRVLLKGGNAPAINNLNQIKQIVDKYSNQIEILVGGSVTKDN